MARTDSSAVTVILETDLTTPQIDAFIATANAWVDHYLADKGLGATLLAEIEKYLAACFASARDPRLKSAKVGDVSETYLRDDNPYCSIAARLDPTGTVETELMGERSVTFRVGAGFDDDLNNLPATS